MSDAMTKIAQSIDLKLAETLKDRDYRRKFFLADCSAGIAAQIIALRKRRGLDQQQVADLIGARQTAISRVENADYQNWSFNTLRNIADALDARIRVLIEPSEDILRQYDGANGDKEPERIEFENADASDTSNP
jgi:transcriptional regulator with XRE-family HTH domain